MHATYMEYMHAIQILLLLPSIYVTGWLASTHNYKYLEMPILTIWSIITRERKDICTKFSMIP